MKEKKYEDRFSIKLNAADPMHQSVIDILNSLGRRSKAQYIVNAVLCYEGQYERHRDADFTEPALNKITQSAKLESKITPDELGDNDLSSINETLARFRTNR